MADYPDWVKQAAAVCYANPGFRQNFEQWIWEEFNKQEAVVTRGPLRIDGSELVLFADDSPARPGYEPQDGESDWQLLLPLDGGQKLVVHIGRRSKETFIALLAAESADDAADEMRS